MHGEQRKREKSAATVATWLGSLIVVAGSSATLPLTSVKAPQVDPPNLDWFHEGHNLEYRFTNGTATRILNATINEKKGSQLLWQYWTTNESGQEWLSYRWQDTNRSDYNITDFYTYLWVNETNVDGGIGDVAIIGNSEYTLEAITTTHFIFSNGSWTFRYDLEDGWLDSADYGDQVSVELIDVRDIDTGHLQVEECRWIDNNGDEKDRRCRSLTTIARATIHDRGTDLADMAALIEVNWPHWHVFDYEWMIELEGKTWSDQHATGPGDILEPLFQQRNNENVETSEADAFSQIQNLDTKQPHNHNPDKANVDITLNV